MVTAIRQFDVLQVGEESTKGTAVAATDQILGNVTFREIRDFYRDSYPRDKRANVGGAGIVLREHSEFEVDMALTAEEIMWPLHTGVLGGVAASNASNEYTWTHTPDVDSAAITVDSFTAEVLRGDGTTNHYAREFAHCMTSGFDIEGTVNQELRMRWRFFGRKQGTTTPTGSLVPIATREPLPMALCSVYIDDAWASLGGTQITNVWRSFRLSVDTMIRPAYTADGRADRDFTGWRAAGPITATLELVGEFDATWATETFGDWRSNNLRYIRIKANGSNVVSNPRYVQIDGAFRFTSEPREQVDGDLRLVALSFESVYDETGDETLEFSYMNGVAAL